MNERKYSWQISVKDHLNDCSWMSERELNAFLKHERLRDVPMETFTNLFFKHQRNFDTPEATNELQEILFNSLGDYDDLKPYSPDSISKLTPDELAFLEERVDDVKKEIWHVCLRRTTL
jgi:hypothetical protein